MRIVVSFALLIAAADSASAYIREKAGSTPLSWPSGQNIQYLINASMKAGTKNDIGDYNIVPGSDPFSAVQSSLDAWNAVSGSAARFSALVEGSGSLGKMDSANVIGFAQTTSARSLVSEAIAVTALYFNVRTGEIVDADIILNPNLTYSTKLALNAYDIQSTITHELGHSLGAGHSPLQSATMYAYGAAETTAPRDLSWDDRAFVTEAYPTQLADPNTGRVSGRIECPSGTCAPAPSVMLFDASRNALVQTTGTTAGDYSFARVSPGSYYLLVEPYVPEYMIPEAVDVTWGGAIYGGTQSPRKIDVAAGAELNANVSVPSPALLLHSFWAGDSFFGARMHSGYAASVMFFMRGHVGEVTEDDVLLLGSGASLQHDSIEADGGDDYSYLAFMLDVPSTTSASTAVVAVRQGDNLVFAPGITITADVPTIVPSDVYNGASLRSGGIAPGEVLGMAGYRLGPNEGVSSDEAKTVGVGVTIAGIEAPILYAEDGYVRVQVPYEISGRESAILSVRNGISVAEDILTDVVSAAPGVVDTAFNEDGTANTTWTPAARGSVVTFYGTGQGVVDPPLRSGEKASSETKSTIPELTIDIDGTPAEVKGAYMVPGAIGIFRIDAVIPRSVSSGWAPLRLSIGKITTTIAGAICIR